MRRAAFFCVTGWLLLLPLLFVGCYSAVASWRWDANCGEWLESAANANTIVIAKDRLDKAVTYIESNNLSSGSCYWLWWTPKTDLKIWYDNLKTTQTELELANDETLSRLEESNVLLKLRETLTDSGGKGGTVVVAPDGISLHPVYGVTMWVFVLTIFLATIGIIMMVVSIELR